MLLLTVAQIVFILLTWQLLRSTESLLPGPAQIGKMAAVEVKTTAFWDDCITSMTLAFKGIFISVIIALLISYLSLLPFFRPLAKFITVMRYLPVAGFVIVVTLLSKDGTDLKTNMLVLSIVPFFVTSFLSIIDSIDKQEFELCSTLKMSRWRTLWEVVIVGRLDQVLEIMRQNFAICWLMIASVEVLSASEGGLGYRLSQKIKYFKLAEGFSYILAIFLIGLFFDYILGALRFWLFPYTKLQIRKQ